MKKFLGLGLDSVFSKENCLFFFFIAEYPLPFLPCLSFLICQMGVIIVPASQEICNN